ncbi:hypothetical protein LguiA_017244 [Lonicera macranthoides]
MACYEKMVKVINSSSKEQGSDLSVMDFKFIVEIGSHNFSPFEIVEKIAEPNEEAARMLIEDMTRMK